MPRGGWLAIGAVLAALGWPDRHRSAGLVGGSGLLARPGGLRPRSWSASRVEGAIAAGLLVPLAAGVLAITVRIATGGPATLDVPMPDWERSVARNRVLGVGSPREGQQTATLSLESAGLRVAATLPRYPDVAPGDLVSMGGRLEPLPADDGGYGTYLRRIGVAATLRARTLDRLGTDGSPASAIEGMPDAPRARR